LDFGLTLALSRGRGDTVPKVLRDFGRLTDCKMKMNAFSKLFSRNREFKNL
jgi:hypothetical protein